ncbi:MAG: T9SS type A sorting domain-containing protein [Bacteroidia bacterium]
MKVFLTVLALHLIFVPQIFSQNLISNPDFEINGERNCQDWYQENGDSLNCPCDSISSDTICGRFYQNTPPNGNIWPWGMGAEGNYPPNRIQTYLTGLSGTNSYKLSIWMKLEEGNGAKGYAGISIKSQGQITLGPSVSGSARDWVKYTIIDTLSLQSTDTVIVSLIAAAAGPGWGTVLFDLVELTLVESLTSIDIPINLRPKVQVYPNPFENLATVEIVNNKKPVTFQLYSLSGQLVRQIENVSGSIELQKGNLESGLYYFQAIEEEEIIGNGRIIIR